MDKQSFRAQLVEWLGEIVPYGQIGKYTRKTREGIETSPYNTDRHANHVNYIFCTAEHRYSISATPTYLGCIASTTRERPGENWTRGNDLPDGPFCRETWESIKNRIIGYEMVKLDPVHVSRGVPDGPPADPEFLTPENLEYNEAYHGVFLAQKRLEKAERVLNGQDKCNPDMPSTRAATEPDGVDALAAVAIKEPKAEPKPWPSTSRKRIVAMATNEKVSDAEFRKYIQLTLKAWEKEPEVVAIKGGNAVVVAEELPFNPFEPDEK